MTTGLSMENDADQLILAEFGTEDIRKMVSLWVHHLPADRARWVAVLPAPDRSDWRAPASGAAPDQLIREETVQELREAVR
jgi:hypothetical protein